MGISCFKAIQKQGGGDYEAKSTLIPLSSPSPPPPPHIQQDPDYISYRSLRDQGFEGPITGLPPHIYEYIFSVEQKGKLCEVDFCTYYNSQPEIHPFILHSAIYYEKNAEWIRQCKLHIKDWKKEIQKSQHQLHVCYVFDFKLKYPSIFQVFQRPLYLQAYLNTLNNRFHTLLIKKSQEHDCIRQGYRHFVYYLLTHVKRENKSHDFWNALFFAAHKFCQFDLMLHLLRSEIEQYGYSKVGYIHDQFIPLLLNHNIEPHTLACLTETCCDLMYKKVRTLRQQCVQDIFGQKSWISYVLLPMIAYEPLYSPR
jgi:hypothetical protein